MPTPDRTIAQARALIAIMLDVTASLPPRWLGGEQWSPMSGHRSLLHLPPYAPEFNPIENV